MIRPLYPYKIELLIALVIIIDVDLLVEALDNGLIFK